MAKPPMHSRLMHVESASGIPVITAKGTPRAIGRALGERLKPRLRVLIQDISGILCQLSGDEQLIDEDGGFDQDAMLHYLDRLLGNSAREALQELDPAQWMELESLAESCKVNILFLLAITAFNDLVKHFQPELSFFASNTAVVPPNRNHDEASLIACDWSVPPYLLPHIMLIRRVPSHGPASLTLSLGGLHSVAGINAAGLAVSSDDLYDSIGDGAGLPTPCMLLSALGANNLPEARARCESGRLFGGRAFHLTNADGERVSIERHAEQATCLRDPSIAAPRIHTNHRLSGHAAPGNLERQVARSSQRLQQLAALALKSNVTTTLQEIDNWFATGIDLDSNRSSRSSMRERPVTGAVVILDPMNACIHCRGSGAGRSLKNVAL
ncbi:MAG: hypothetical protein ACOCXA_06175 [Planctomycetota bacterium]